MKVETGQVKHGLAVPADAGTSVNLGSLLPSVGENFIEMMSNRARRRGTPLAERDGGFLIAIALAVGAIIIAVVYLANFAIS